MKKQIRPLSTALAKKLSSLFIFLLFINIAYTQPIVVVSPNGGEQWLAGNGYEIKWTGGGGEILVVAISYSIDSGSTWNLLSSSVYNTGSYAWYVPNTPSTKCLVKVAESGSSSDVSDAVFTIVGTTGVNNNLSDDFTYEVFPNPTISKINIKYTGGEIKADASLSILDITGKTVKEEKLRANRFQNNVVSIDLAGKPSGVYFLKLTQGDVSTVKRIVVE